jgi:hypothetical protein
MNRWTVADYVALVAPHCVEPFFSPEAYARVVATGRSLPAELSGSLMFERRLDAVAGDVDLLLWVPTYGRRDVLAGIPEPLLREPAWRRVRDFGRAWLQASSPVHGVVSFWIEIDIRGPAPEVPVPVVFFTVESHQEPEPALAILCEQAGDSPHLQVFRRAWDLLPAAARYRTAGLLYSRPSAGIRIIAVLPHDEAFRYLERVGWPGSAAGLAREVDGFLSFHDEVSLHIEVDGGVRPEVGLEIYADRASLYNNCGGDGAAVLDLAVRSSLCLPGLRDALLAWSGTGEEHLPDGTPVATRRAFHHLKLVAGQEGPIRAKAYTTVDCKIGGEKGTEP